MPEEKWRKIQFDDQPFRLDSRKIQFDDQQLRPDTELEEIKKLPAVLKKSAVQRYKEKLIRQKDGLAKIQTTLLLTLNERPDKPLDELMALIKKQAAKYLLCPPQVEALERFIKEYQKKHKWVELYYNATADHAEIYRICLNRQPQGRIYIIKENINFCFRCFDFEDYFHFFTFPRRKKMSPKKEKKEREKAQKSGGCFITGAAIKELDGTLTASKTKFFRPDIIMHETQHALYNIFPKKKPERYQGRLRFYNSKNETERLIALPAYCRWLRAEMEESAKDEILAYYKINRPKTYIEEVLFLSEKEGGLYDYYSENKKKYAYIKEFFHQTSSYKIKKIMDKMFIDEYRQLITQGLNAVTELEKMNYRHKKIMALLMPEPLIQWPKLVKRIKEIRLTT